MQEPGPTIPATALPSQRLAGKVVLVTGGGGFIALDTSARLLLEGANIALVDINPDALAKGIAKLVDFASGAPIESRVLTIVADLTSEKDVDAATAKAVDKFGRLDVAFLNAGISYSATSILDTTEAMYDRIMNINIKSAFLGIKSTAKAMQESGHGGSIILTSSIAGLRGTPGLALYSASKFAVRGLALTAASELGPSDIRVNTIHPSGVNTPMFQASWSPEKMLELKNGMPLGRFAETSDVAGVVTFLASDDSRFMTGGFLKIDGGCVSF